MELQVIEACDQNLEEEGAKQQVPHRLRVTLDKLHYVLTRRAFYFILSLPSSFFFTPSKLLSLSFSPSLRYLRPELCQPANEGPSHGEETVSQPHRRHRRLGGN